MHRKLATRLFQSTWQPMVVRSISRHMSALPSCDGLVVETKDQVVSLRLDRPKKFNAITREMYTCLTEIFTKANKDASIKAMILSGTGDYYSSGNDLSNFTMAMQDENGMRAGLVKSKDILFDFVNSIINLDKFLIGAINGPAVGISVTILPLFDYVIASDKATFHTPFTALGMCPEGCSSYTLPQIMGRTRANELLLLNMTWDSKRAKDNGLISEVIEHNKLGERVDQLTKHIVASCYPKALLVGKQLSQNANIREKLIAVNRLECDTILDCWCGPECADAIQKFFARTKK